MSRRFCFGLLPGKAHSREPSVALPSWYSPSLAAPLFVTEFQDSFWLGQLESRAHYKPISVEKQAALCWLARSRCRRPSAGGNTGSTVNISMVCPEPVESTLGRQIRPDNLWRSLTLISIPGVQEALVSPDTLPAEVLHACSLHGQCVLPIKFTGAFFKLSLLLWAVNQRGG